MHVRETISKMDKLKPTPTKISTGSFIATLILTVIVIFMESYKKNDSNLNPMYMTCYTNGIQRKGYLQKVLFLTCQKNEVKGLRHAIMPVISERKMTTSNVSMYSNSSNT